MITHKSRYHSSLSIQYTIPHGIYKYTSVLHKSLPSRSVESRKHLRPIRSTSDSLIHCIYISIYLLGCNLQIRFILFTDLIEFPNKHWPVCEVTAKSPFSVPLKENRMLESFPVKSHEDSH